MIPVVLINYGKQEYLQYTINQALKKNKVILLTDLEAPQFNHNNFIQENINNLVDSDYLNFSKNYIHMSTNSYQFELVCFLRWFLLKKYMDVKKIETVFYIDSDVFFYADANLEYKKYEQYDMTLIHRTAAVSSFITSKGINNFCNFLSKTYSEKNSYEFEKIKSHYEVRRKFNLPGGVCDMTLFDFFHYHFDVGGGPGRVGEMMNIIDDSTYDHNINSKDQYYKFDGLRKEIEFKDGNPYVFNYKLNKYIKFNSIHFQGSAKSLMKEYYERKK